MMHIRLAQFADLGWISDLWQKEMPSFWSSNMIESSFTEAGALTLVSCHQEEGIGFIMGTTLGCCEIYGIAVASSCQRRGVGGGLLQTFLEQAHSCGCSSVFLEVAETNVVARRLYERHAFHEIGKRSQYYNDVDALVLKHDLS